MEVWLWRSKARLKECPAGRCPELQLLLEVHGWKQMRLVETLIEQVAGYFGLISKNPLHREVPLDVNALIELGKHVAKGLLHVQRSTAIVLGQIDVEGPAKNLVAPFHL